MGIRDRLVHAWNVFLNDDYDQRNPFGESGSSYSTPPSRPRIRIGSERTIIASIYTRMAVDVAATSIRHVRLDDEKRYKEEIESGLNSCLSLAANLDQPGRAFRQDIAMSLFENGVIAVVPVDTTINPDSSGGWDILSMRVGTIVSWFPSKVKVSIYNEQNGRRQEVTLDKKFVAIVENPLYTVMNEPNSTLQRLIRKLGILDAIDEQSGSGKLDIIIQLPYVIKSEGKRQQAEQRRKDIEFQLKGSQYGIAYTDGTEKVTQLNRPAENNLMKQIEYLVDLLYAQLGLTPEVMNGTADESAMLNYYDRTINPILDAIVESMRRSFLTKTARTQGQSIEYYKDPFKLVPISQMAEIADKFTRNEIVSSNEMRQAIGMKPAKDPKADELRNSNMPQSELGTPPPGGSKPDPEDPEDPPPAAAPAVPKK